MIIYYVNLISVIYFISIDSFKAYYESCLLATYRRQNLPCTQMHVKDLLQKNKAFTCKVYSKMELIISK